MVKKTSRWINHKLFGEFFFSFSPNFVLILRKTKTPQIVPFKQEYDSRFTKFLGLRMRRKNSDVDILLPLLYLHVVSFSQIPQSRQRNFWRTTKHPCYIRENVFKLNPRKIWSYIFAKTNSRKTPLHSFSSTTCPKKTLFSLKIVPSIVGSKSIEVVD